MFSLRTGDSIRERVGGSITSLLIVGVSWMEAFVILGAFEIDSLLVSEPHDAHKKTIRIAETIRKSQPRCFNFSIPSILIQDCCLDFKKLLKELLVIVRDHLIMLMKL